MTDPSATASTPPAGPTPLLALGMTVSVIPLIGGYIALCGVLGNHEFYTGFLFLLCWTGFEQGKLAKLPHSALGSAFGLALGLALKLLVGGPLGTAGGYLFGLLALSVVYLHILGRGSLLINFSCMTFLATITIPHVQMHGDFAGMTIALLIGIAYFGTILGTIEKISARRVAAGA
ncbi:hypothetical protein [Solimonas terrae]|uniref:DUF1097 domain-containing protein n=1 Tax=Solimonas terrae TaxID=1396819 RepID=A0A6M2BNQ0_9GAMM|nr:hypothetical protein [Solimonas terrae]NGY03960.1 hypothetical protein [Solimonas terrae]